MASVDGDTQPTQQAIYLAGEPVEGEKPETPGLVTRRGHPASNNSPNFTKLQQVRFVIVGECVTKLSVTYHVPRTDAWFEERECQRCHRHITSGDILRFSVTSFVSAGY